MLATFFVVVSNLDISGLFDYDLVAGTRVLRARSLVDCDTTAFCGAAGLLDAFLVLVRH